MGIVGFGFPFIMIVPLIIGICLFVSHLKSRKKFEQKGKLKLSHAIIGYFSCVAINTFAGVICFGYYLVGWDVPILCYNITIAPFIFFSIIINKNIIKDKKIHNTVIRIAYKVIATLLIWFIALLPFWIGGITAIVMVHT